MARPMPDDPDHHHSGLAPDNADALSDAPPQPNMQDIIARGRDGMARAGAGSKAALLGYCDAGQALIDARHFNVDGRYLDAKQLAEVARQMGIRNATDARDLPRFAAKWPEIVPIVEAEEVKARAKGGQASYGWRRLWRIVEPPAPRERIREAPPDPMSPALMTRALKKAEEQIKELETQNAEVSSEARGLLVNLDHAADLFGTMADVMGMEDREPDRIVSEVKHRLLPPVAEDDDAELAKARKRAEHAEAELARVQQERDAARARIRELESQLADIGKKPKAKPPPAPEPTPEAAAKKIVAAAVARAKEDKVMRQSLNRAVRKLKPTRKRGISSLAGIDPNGTEQLPPKARKRSYRPDGPDSVAPRKAR
jgi:hypothetical protein